MSVLIYADQQEGKIKKSTFEVLSYGAHIAEAGGTQAVAVVMGRIAESELKELGKYGIARVLHADDEKLHDFDGRAYADVMAEAVRQSDSDVIVFPHNFHGKAIAPLLSVKLKAGLVTGAVALPDTTDGFTVKKGVFSGKAFAHVRILSPVKIIALSPNSFSAAAPAAKEAEVVKLEASLQEKETRVKVKAVEKLSGDIPLTEAEMIVSGGRGLKGPENWGMIEDLARALGAATACSRPVADAGWRPHHEHVGQTGLTVRPNLYIAVGISGAIQHLAGVNGSKHIVVINKDPEAPFFKAADYGIVGDAFEVVPRLTEAVRQYKSSGG